MSNYFFCKRCMKKDLIYKTLASALGIVACVSVFAADRAERRSHNDRMRQANAAYAVIADGIKEVSYDLSVIYWSADRANYLASVRNIERACGRMEGAIDACGAGFESYREYCRSLSGYVGSLPEERDDDVRSDCLALRDINDKLLERKRQGGGGGDDAIAEFIEKADSLSYSPSRYFKSSSGVCATDSAPLDTSSSSSR